MSQNFPKVEAEMIGDIFSESSLGDGLCAWIDILGTQDTEYSSMSVRRLIDMAALVSSNHANIGPSEKHQFVSNAKVNTVVVGDAICISQKKASDSVDSFRSAVPLVAAFCSWNLFNAGLPHRGGIAKGFALFWKSPRYSIYFWKRGPWGNQRRGVAPNLVDRLFST